MSKRIKKNLDFMRLLQVAKKPQRKALLSTMEPEQVNCLCEAAQNVLRGNVKLSPTQKRKLSRYKALMRKLIKRNTGIKERKKLIAKQTGGFFPALLGPALGLATSLLGGLLTK